MEEIKEKFIKRKFLTNELLENFIINRIKEENIEDYVNELFIDSKVYSGYCMVDHKIYINPNEILYERKNKKIPNVEDIISKKERKTNIIKDPNNPNIYTLFSINHELTHAYQTLLFEEKICSDNFSKYRLMLLEKSICTEAIDETYFKDYYYDEFHDYFFSEYDANINGYINTLNFINSLDIKEIKENIEKFNELIAKNLLYLYKDIERKRKASTPYNNFLKIEDAIRRSLIKSKIDIPNLYFDIYDDLVVPNNEYNKLKLGLPLNNDVFKYLNMVKCKKHKTLNLFNDIKNI